MSRQGGGTENSGGGGGGEQHYLSLSFLLFRTCLGWWRLKKITCFEYVPRHSMNAGIKISPLSLAFSLSLSLSCVIHEKRENLNDSSLLIITASKRIIAHI